MPPPAPPPRCARWCREPARASRARLCPRRPRALLPGPASCYRFPRRHPPAPAASGRSCGSTAPDDDAFLSLFHHTPDITFPHYNRILNRSDQPHAATTPRAPRPPPPLEPCPAPDEGASKIGQFSSGEGGIRTLGTLWVHTLSRRAPSAARAPLRPANRRKCRREVQGDGARCGSSSAHEAHSVVAGRGGMDGTPPSPRPPGRRRRPRRRHGGG